MIELTRGYLWIQSHANHQGHRIQTANATIEYQKGESIVSFDHYAGKTQLLVIKGKVQLGNMLHQGMNVTVSDGKFSFVDNDYNDGVPRRPTSIGFSSFKNIKKYFSRGSFTIPLTISTADHAWSRVKSKYFALI